ncbi:large subunit ribosomal protein L25 [Flexibacter flexilis DSM 6793]|uniref:Large ribosomal subunit protein bL25 n=1 Tax=Flexibacter flexilis DSM 6793 TaxID=927664 RepID=A0A1I1E5Z1_9BACT|nr:50S ribosomal protein L25/general stress protein Ctc [Flexibacter flexilis]SFB82066.1 large subunit ribosomal protein L25 [Flexibacter flexilis DSM 6793]
MKSVEIIGFKRANLGKTEAKALRLESNVPCVLYGGNEQVHFYVPAILFRDLVYTPNAYTVSLNVEGKLFDAILQDIQFHPVNDMILHADFLVLDPAKEVKMNVPVRVEGTSVGVQKGGKLSVKLRKLTVKALPAALPDFVTVDVSALDLGKTIKVGQVKAEGFAILNAPNIPVVSIEIPRALKNAARQ